MQCWLLFSLWFVCRWIECAQTVPYKYKSGETHFWFIRWKKKTTETQETKDCRKKWNARKMKNKTKRSIQWFSENAAQIGFLVYVYSIYCGMQLLLLIYTQRGLTMRNVLIKLMPDKTFAKHSHRYKFTETAYPILLSSAIFLKPISPVNWFLDCMRWLIKIIDSSARVAVSGCDYFIFLKKKKNQTNETILTSTNTHSAQQREKIP